MWPVEDTGRNSVTPSMMPRITARTASDIMIKSAVIERSQKAGFFSPIRPHAAIAKNRQNTGCLARLLGYSVFEQLSRSRDKNAPKPTIRASVLISTGAEQALVSAISIGAAFRG